MRWAVTAGVLIALLISTMHSATVRAASALPNDPLLKEQWGWFDVYANRAYNTSYHGQGVKVAVLDTGVDTNHPDLKANLDLAEAWNFIDGNNNVTDTDGHGTMTTGIIAAIANNSLGIAGVAPNVTILPLKILSSQGGSFINVDQAILYAVQHGARVISMSFGGQPGRLGIATETAIQSAYSSGVVLVAAAGNSNSSQPFYPAAYSQVIAVSAVSLLNQKSGYSNFGSYIELAAPGDSIWSTYLGGRYAYGSGTSFAAPFVTAVVALMLSRNSSMTPTDVRSTLNQEAIDLGPPGYDQYYGYGLVNACAAVSSNCPTTPGWTNGNSLPPLTSITLTGIISSASIVTSVAGIFIRNRRSHEDHVWQRFRQTTSTAQPGPSGGL